MLYVVSKTVMSKILFELPDQYYCSFKPVKTYTFTRSRVDHSRIIIPLVLTYLSYLCQILRLVRDVSWIENSIAQSEFYCTYLHTHKHVLRHVWANCFDTRTMSSNVRRTECDKFGTITMYGHTSIAPEFWGKK